MLGRKLRDSIRRMGILDMVLAYPIRADVAVNRGRRRVHQAREVFRLPRAFQQVLRTQDILLDVSGELISPASTHAGLRCEMVNHLGVPDQTLVQVAQWRPHESESRIGQTSGK